MKPSISSPLAFFLYPFTRDLFHRTIRPVNQAKIGPDSPGLAAVGLATECQNQHPCHHPGNHQAKSGLVGA
jgi:hypothetical protein